MPAATPVKPKSSKPLPAGTVPAGYVSKRIIKVPVHKGGENTNQYRDGGVSKGGGATVEYQILVTTFPPDPDMSSWPRPPSCARPRRHLRRTRGGGL